VFILDTGHFRFLQPINTPACLNTIPAAA